MLHLDCFPNLLVDISAEEFNFIEISRDNEVSNSGFYWKSLLEGVLLICMEDGIQHVNLLKNIHSSELYKPKPRAAHYC